MDFIRDNKHIRDALYKRITELKLLFREVVDDAYGYGITVSQAQLSRYFKGHSKDIPRQAVIGWLCKRYGIDVEFKIKVERYNDEKHKRQAREFAKKLNNKG